MDRPDSLAACFRNGQPPFAIFNAKWTHCDWEAFIESASAESVLPLLRSRLQEIGALSQTPVEIVHLLALVEQLNLERNEAILDELAEIATMLNERGIEPVLLKGVAYFATGVCGQAGRYLLDIDLLIPERQLASAVQSLMENGFDWDRTDRLGHFRHHHPPLRRTGVSVELHHSMGMGPCEALLPASEVLNRSTPYTLKGARVRVPSPEHMLVHLVMHSQIQHPYTERIWPPLRALLDLALLLSRFQRDIDWRAVESRFRRAGQYGVLALHFAQARETLGVTPPIPMVLKGLTRARWFRRRLLQLVPTLRFVDPIFAYSILFARRLRLVRNAMSEPWGWARILSELCTPGFVSRFITGFIHSR